MSDTDKTQQLIDAIRARRRFDQKWGDRCFICSQIFTWIAIVSSLGSAIAAATGRTPPVLIAALAAVPGVIVAIQKEVPLGSRAHWHWIMAARLQKLENSLIFEGSPVEEVSRTFSDLQIEMDERYPDVPTSGDIRDKKPEKAVEKP